MSHRPAASSEGQGDHQHAASTPPDLGSGGGVSRSGGSKGGGKAAGWDDRERRGASGPTDGSVVDRRMWPDRRRDLELQGRDGAPDTGLERRRGPGRRLSDFTRSAEEGQLTSEQFLFLMAIEEFKRANAKPFPSWTDVLEVVRLLGYRKTASMEVSLRQAEDWRESPDAPSGVRPDRWAQRAQIDRQRGAGGEDGSGEGPRSGGGREAA